jgi:hypothetical protein
MNEAKEVLYLIVMSDNQSPVVLQPGKQPFYFPASPVAPQSPPILCGGFSSIVSVWSYHLYSSLCQLQIQWIAVICLIPYKMLRPLIGKTLGESVFDKGDLMRASRSRVDGDRKTRAVCHCHELRTFAPLGLSHTSAPFFATTNVPSMKHSLKSSPPLVLRSWARVSSTSFRTPPLTHCWNLRWQVWYGGNRSGRSFHLAPLRSIQSMPFRTSRLSLHGLPRPSWRLARDGIRGSMIAHCSSVNSSRLAIIPIIIAELGIYETASSKKPT